MKTIHHIFLILALALMAGCQTVDAPAPDPVGDLKAYPGIGRVLLTFSVPEDAFAGKVFYNSGSIKKFFVDPSAAEQKVMVDGLTAGENVLRVVTMDVSGRESLPKGIKVEVYGESFYPGALANRNFISMTELSASAVKVNFSEATGDEAYVVISYSDAAGQLHEKIMSRDETSVTVEGVDVDLPMTFRTVYKPTEDFLDEYAAPTINIQDAALMQLNKENWLTTASGSDAAAPVELLKDGRPSTSWKAAQSGPQTITIDMQSVKLFSGIALSQGWDLSDGTMAGHFLCEMSNDATNWTTILDKKLAHNAFAQIFPLANPARAQYLRITLDNPMDDRPIQLGEIDLYNDLNSTLGEDVSTMPQLVNAKVPISGDGAQDLATPVGAGRMQRAVGWNTSDETIITTDTSVGGLCIFSAHAWGISNVVNGKVWQTLDLMPGYYSLDWNFGSLTDERGVDAFGIVAKGHALPDIDAATSDPSVLASFPMENYKSAIYNQEFSLSEPTTVTIGWVFTTYDLYVITGSIPWSDLYINSIELNTR